MKNKGFTLIELLAVIVVLAVIALIATPIVLKLVNNAKEGAAESSATAYIKAVENGIIAKLIKEPDTSFKGTFTVSQDKTKIVSESGTEIEVDVKGNLPSQGGTVTIGDNGIVTSATFNISNYEIECTTDNCKVKGKKEPEEEIITGPTSEDADTTKTKGLIKIVYLDPTDLTKTCNASNSVSTIGTKNGCMKWYVYKDDGTNYTMILDHNTTASVTYNLEGSNTEMKEIKTELDNLVLASNWKVTPRLITADEIAQITGATETLQWTSDKIYANTPVIGTSISYFYLDGAAGTDTTWHTQIATTEGTSKYAWLYDYTNTCTSYGCNVVDSGTYGYWTSTPVASITSNTWVVYRCGFLSSYNVVTTGSYGVRPVITVSKSIIR